MSTINHHNIYSVTILFSAPKKQKNYQVLTQFKIDLTLFAIYALLIQQLRVHHPICPEGRTLFLISYSVSIGLRLGCAARGMCIGASDNRSICVCFHILADIIRYVGLVHTPPTHMGDGGGIICAKHITVAHNSHMYKYTYTMSPEPPLSGHSKIPFVSHTIESCRQSANIERQHHHHHQHGPHQDFSHLRKEMMVILSSSRK